LMPGESLGVIGRNGAGKSTLLRIVAGIYKPNTGKLIRRCKSATLLSLQAGFEPELSGWDNALLSGALMGIPIPKCKSALPQIAEFSELGKAMDDPIKTYSSGMVARLGFAIGMTLKPDILLIDEVLGVGDGPFRQKAEKALENKINGNQTVVLVSHSMGLMNRLCDRIVWLENHSVKMIGKANEVIDAYEESSQAAN